MELVSGAGVSDFEEHVKRLALNSAVNHESADRVIEVRTCAITYVGADLGNPPIQKLD